MVDCRAQTLFSCPADCWINSVFGVTFWFTWAYAYLVISVSVHRVKLMLSLTYVLSTIREKISYENDFDCKRILRYAKILSFITFIANDKIIYCEPWQLNWLTKDLLMEFLYYDFDIWKEIHSNSGDEVQTKEKSTKLTHRLLWLDWLALTHFVSNLVFQVIKPILFTLSA